MCHNVKYICFIHIVNFLILCWAHDDGDGDGGGGGGNADDAVGDDMWI